MGKRSSSLISKIVIGITLLILSLITLKVSIYSQPRPLVVLTEADLQDEVIYDAWIEFKDKDIHSEKQRLKILKDLEKSFHPRALKRRKKKRTYPGLFDKRDFPLAARYLAGVAKTGAEVRIKSCWLNGVSILANKKQILNIKKFPFVKDVLDFHEHKSRKQLKTRPKPQKRDKEDISSIYGRSEVQVSQLGLDRLHKAGYTGSGIVIAVIDCGFDLSHIAFKNSAHPLHVIAQKDFVENDRDVIPRPGIDPDNYDHGTLVLGTIASYFPNELIGSAYDADFILCNAEDGPEEYFLEERWFVAALEFAESQGADVATSSLVLYGGYSQNQLDGKTAVMTVGLNIAAGNGVICLSGAGNSGNDQNPETSHLMAPGDSADVITVGAINSKGIIAGFSSDGPTKDGRLKPEVLARGVGTWTISLSDNQGYSQAGGTSVATPVMAGAVACLLQVHPDWTVQQVRTALFHSGNFFRKQKKPDPLFVQGYGIPDVYAAAGLK